MTKQITHQLIDGRMIQIVSAQTLRQILDADGDDYSRPSDFGPDDEWIIDELDREYLRQARRNLFPE